MSQEKLWQLWDRWKEDAGTKQEAVDDYFWHGAASFCEFLADHLHEENN